MFDFYGFFLMVSHIAILLSGATVLITPTILAFSSNWRYLYYYVPIALIFWCGAQAFRPQNATDDGGEEAEEDESN